MQKYFVNILQLYPLKTSNFKLQTLKTWTFSNYFSLEPKGIIFQNHPFKAFLVSKTYTYIDL